MSKFYYVVWNTDVWHDNDLVKRFSDDGSWTIVEHEYALDEINEIDVFLTLEEAEEYVRELEYSDSFEKDEVLTIVEEKLYG